MGQWLTNELRKFRKTGLIIKDTGQRDDFGMEPIVGFFSPEVSATLGIRNPNAGPSSTSKTSENQTNSVEESMDIVTSMFLHLPAALSMIT